MEPLDISNLLDRDVKLKLTEINLINQSERKRVDSFFIHQCIIRRFKYYYRNDYDLLLKFRHDIESKLRQFKLRPTPKLFFELSSTELALRSMNFLGNEKHRSLLRSETSGTELRDEFYEYLNLKRMIFPKIDSFLNNNQLDEIIKILKSNLEFCEALFGKYNIFDCYSLFSMTVYIDFDIFLKFYLGSRHTKSNAYVFSEDVDPSAWWLYSKADKISDSNIYISIQSNCFIPYFYSSNVSVITDNDNDIVINGINSKNSIYLKVRVDQIPINIDAAVQYFKCAALELLMDHYKFRANINDEKFENSEFVKSYEKNVYFIKQWNCINRIILGLWCWDIAKNENFSPKKAADEVIKILPKHHLQYEASSIDSYYENISDIISFKKRKLNEVTLDKFLTGSDSIILGQRNN